MAAYIGRRLRRGAATTAVAAAAMAALTASQAPGFSAPNQDGSHRTKTPSDTPIDGGSSYRTELPPLKSTGAPSTHPAKPGAGGAEAGIPATVLDAYKKAEAALRQRNPGCNLRWELLAAIGKVESGQARNGEVDAAGTTVKPILGPVLNGKGFARIADTDHGRYDGDPVHDRAVGPMQFIPSTWNRWGTDANGDGRKDPNNVYDAALAAGDYLCADGRDLSVQSDLNHAILGYNHSQDYLGTVLSWYEFYKNGTHEVPDTPAAGGSPDHGSSGHPSHSGSGSHGSPPSKSGSGGGHSGSKPKPDPSASVRGFESVGDLDLTAEQSQQFAASPQVRAKTSAGKPVAGAHVQFEIRGTTQARFPDGATKVTVKTGSDGLATAPKLTAGNTAGKFTVRASVVGGSVPTIDFGATVAADTLARTDNTPLTATTNGSFTTPLTVTTAYQGKPEPNVPVTATMVTSDPNNPQQPAQPPTQNDKGPYFKDDKGQPVRTLTTLKTDANGKLVLPTIYTDGQAGTFLLHLTTPDGGDLTVTLTVTAPAS